MVEGAVCTDHRWFRDSKTQSLHEKYEHNCSSGYFIHIYNHLNWTCCAGAIHMCRIRKYDPYDQKTTSYLACPAHYVLHKWRDDKLPLFEATFSIMPSFYLLNLFCKKILSNFAKKVFLNCSSINRLYFQSVMYRCSSVWFWWFTVLGIIQETS